MKEAENTIEVLRTDYMQKVQSWLRDHYEDYLGDAGRAVTETTERCTTLQLRSLCILIDRKSPGLKILPCNPTDHLAVTFAGMYCGIEPDGYTHS